MKGISELLAIMQSELGISTEEITENSLLADDLGMTSFDMMSLIFAIEEKYKCQLHIDGLSKVVTVQELFEWIQEDVK